MGATISRPTLGITRVVGSPNTADTSSLVAAAGASTKIRVVWMILNCGGGANSVTFKSATTAISPVFSFADKGGMVLEKNMEGWFETAANEAFQVTLSAATLVGIHFGYITTS